MSKFSMQLTSINFKRKTKGYLFTKVRKINDILRFLKKIRYLKHFDVKNTVKRRLNDVKINEPHPFSIHYQ